MKIHLLGSPVSCRRSVEDIEGPIVPSAAGSAAAERISSFSHNPPNSARKRLGREELNRIEEEIVAGSSHGHRLQKYVGVEPVKDAQHFDRAMSVDKIDCPFVVELRVESKQPNPNLV